MQAGFRILIALLAVSMCSVLFTLLAVGELEISVRLKSASTPLPRSADPVEERAAVTVQQADPRNARQHVTVCVGMWGLGGWGWVSVGGAGA